MRPGRESPIGIAPQFDHRELQRLRGGLDGLLVFGPEPGGLGERGAAGRAVDQDGGTGFGFGWVRLVIEEISLNQKDPERGPGVERERHAKRDHDGGCGMGDALVRPWIPTKSL